MYWKRTISSAEYAAGLFTSCRPRFNLCSRRVLVERWALRPAPSALRAKPFEVSCGTAMRREAYVTIRRSTYFSM